MHDGVRLRRQHGAEHGVAVGHVEGGVVGRRHLVARRRAGRGHVVAELAAGAGDEDPHPRAFRGSHHQRLSRYQATVASIASPSSRSGRHPSASTFVVSIE